MLYLVDAHGHHDDAQYWPFADMPSSTTAAWRCMAVFEELFALELDGLSIAELSDDDPIARSWLRIEAASGAEICDFMRWCFYTDIAETLEKIIELRRKA